jgi:hypothetical protein
LSAHSLSIDPAGKVVHISRCAGAKATEDRLCDLVSQRPHQPRSGWKESFSRRPVSRGVGAVTRGDTNPKTRSARRLCRAIRLTAIITTVERRRPRRPRRGQLVGNSRCRRMRSTICARSMSATRGKRPPHRGHPSTSMPNVRGISSAQSQREWWAWRVAAQPFEAIPLARPHHNARVQIEAGVRRMTRAERASTRWQAVAHAGGPQGSTASGQKCKGQMETDRGSPPRLSAFACPAVALAKAGVSWHVKSRAVSVCVFAFRVSPYAGRRDSTNGASLTVGVFFRAMI